MRKSRIAMLFFAGLCALMPLFANGGKDIEMETAEEEVVTLNIYLFGQDGAHYRNVNEVLGKVNEKLLEDGLNIQIDVTFTPPADHFQKTTMWVAAGEDIDIMFSSSHLQQLAADGAFADLEGYFQNDEYPGLKKAFSSDFIDANRVGGKVYAVPITNTFMDMEGISYRKDLLEKYGMPPIEDYDDLYEFLTKVKENENPNLFIPYESYGTWGYFKEFVDRNERELVGRVYELSNINKMEYLQVAFTEEGEFAGVATLGDTDEAYAGFNSKYGKQWVIDRFTMAKEWNKFLVEDVLVDGTPTPPFSGASYTTIYKFPRNVANLKQKDPNAELAFWPIKKNNRDLTPGGQSTDYKAWNQVTVLESSEKKDECMKFLDWVYCSQENNDLLQYGIEGKDWIAVGDDQYKTPEGVEQNSLYAWPGYQIGWTPIYHRTQVVTPEIKKMYDYQFSTDTFTANDLTGFSFDASEVTDELAKCHAIYEEHMRILKCGLADDVKVELDIFHKELVDAGVDKIKEEITSQLNAFIANK